MVLQRLDAEFEKLRLCGASSKSKMIEKCASKAHKLHAAALEEEAEEDNKNGDKVGSGSASAETASEQSESSSDGEANSQASEDSSEEEDQSVMGV